MNDSLPSNVSVISNHHDPSSVMLMKQNWNLYLWNGLLFSWLSSLNPFCLTRCKRELLYLMSFSWINDLLCLSCIQWKHVADENHHMVAYCTIDSSQQLRGRYKLQSKPSVQIWERKKKKRRWHLRRFPSFQFILVSTTHSQQCFSPTSPQLNSIERQYFF